MNQQQSQPYPPTVVHTVTSHDLLDKQLSFSKVDQNASGTIELEEVLSALPQIPSTQVAQIFANADRNKDGHLDRQEYSGFVESVKSHTSNLVEYVVEYAVLPERERSSSMRNRQTSQSQVGLHETPPLKIKKKFPIFIVSLSFVQWLIFAYFMNEVVVLLCIFNPQRRYEIWRYVTVMLIHGSYLHLFGNVIMQLILGCCLEVIHHWKRVGIVYLGGVLFGTLASSVVQPWTYLIGASGGVYALLIAHLSTIILNWKEMGNAPLRCTFLLCYIAWDVWLVINKELIQGLKSNTSHAGHFGGALAGLVIGVNVLKNFEERWWELRLQKVCKFIAIIFVIVCIAANVGFEIYYLSR